MIKLLSAAIAVTCFALPAMADNFNYRPHNDRFVERGYWSGRLSPYEARRLDREERYIASQRRAALSDGYLSGRERNYLRGLEAQHRRNVWRDRRD